jgi:hypothetical protein
MTSLLSQIEGFKREEEEEKKEGYNIEYLESYNKCAETRRKQLSKKNRNLINRCELETLYHTKPRFDIILEILKKQDARIEELENWIKHS